MTAIRFVARRPAGVAFRCLILAIRTGAVGLGAIGLTGCQGADPIQAPAAHAAESAPAARGATDPEWARDAVFYQIFAERFANGDRTNDPDRASLEDPDVVPPDWAVTDWTADWYARAKWERAMGDDFYADGVMHRRYGGDLQGVLDRLDYLQDLGVTVLYFNPVFYARSVHKYDGSSMHHVDPHFGPDPAGDFALMGRESSDPASWRWTAADKLFLKLLAEAHRRGIRVVIDGVFNHTGRDFFAFADIKARQEQSPYVSWYTIERFDDPKTPENEFKYRSWWGFETLPEFADNEAGDDLHPGPKKYVLDITARWMDPNADGDPADGVDGWRLDVANEVPVRFWRDWHALVARLNPRAYTVAEIWESAGEYLERAGFNATMNYHGFAFPVKGYLVDRALPAGEFAAQLEARRAEHRPHVQYRLQNLVDSHDTDRLASMIVNAGVHEYLQPARFDFDVGERVSPRRTDRYLVRKPTERERQIQRLVALFQMTYVGAPMVYYGTEAGMWSGDDPDDRMPMLWPDLTYETQAADPLGRPRPRDEVAFDKDLHDYYRRAIALRREHAALRRGDFRVLATDDANHALAFARCCEGQAVVVVLNRGDATCETAVPLEAIPGAAASDLEPRFVSAGSPEDVVTRAADGAVRIQLPPLTGAVLRVK